MNTFSKIASIIIAVAVLFIFPLLYFAQKQDAITQTYVMTETVKLVDAIKNTGRLSVQEYNSFIKKLDETNNIYSIKFEHAHEVINPIYNDDTVFLDDFNRNYICVYEEDILQELYEGSGEYHFSQGDYITIKVINRNKTFAAKIQQTIYQIEMPVEQIYVTYGGVVRDETK